MVWARTSRIVVNVIAKSQRHVEFRRCHCTRVAYIQRYFDRSAYQRFFLPPTRISTRYYR